MAPWLLIYTASSGSRRARRDRIASIVSVKKPWSTGPPGSVAVTMIGTGPHVPARSISAMKPGISAGIAGAGFAASATISSSTR